MLKGITRRINLIHSLEKAYIPTNIWIHRKPKKLKETQLPPKEAFYSRLNDEGISDENYAHALKVWKTFEDYHNLYNRVDVLLLCDVLENFRNICCKH